MSCTHPKAFHKNGWPSRCRLCHSEYCRQHYAANKEARKAQMLDYYRRTKSQRKAYQKRYDREAREFTRPTQSPTWLARKPFEEALKQQEHR